MLPTLIGAALSLVPTPVMRRLASRYIAGETLAEALAQLEELAASGHPGILDVLGEGVRDAERARRVASDYREAASALAARGLDAYVSIKPTHVGLGISEDLAFELYSEVCAHAAGAGIFVRVEMEDHPTIDGTLRVFERLRREHANVGCVLQSRLFRTPRDIAALAPGPLDVRLVKGIYLEPAEIAHTDADAIREAYVECARLLAERGAHLRLATHDAGLAGRCVRLLEELGRRRVEHYEFQVLLGVQRPLWERWRAEGHRVRVYVPYGPDWRAYSTRRLRHNPNILRHVMADTLRLS